MTADADLLPLPEGEAIGWTQAWSYDQMRSYARANVSRATARLQAEIEALRAEVGELHMHAKRRDQYAVEKAAQALDWKKRAERLAEALRRYRNEVPIGHQPHMLAHEVDDLLRDQEEGK